MTKHYITILILTAIMVGIIIFAAFGQIQAIFDCAHV